MLPLGAPVKRGEVHLTFPHGSTFPPRLVGACYYSPPAPGSPGPSLRGAGGSGVGQFILSILNRVLVLLRPTVHLRWDGYAERVTQYAVESAGFAGNSNNPNFFRINHGIPLDKTPFDDLKSRYRD